MQSMPAVVVLVEVDDVVLDVEVDVDEVEVEDDELLLVVVGVGPSPHRSIPGHSPGDGDAATAHAPPSSTAHPDSFRKAVAWHPQSIGQVSEVT